MNIDLAKSPVSDLTLQITLEGEDAAMLDAPQCFLATEKEDFERLANEWERNRRRGVDLADMAMDTAYQQIIGMGPQAIPWLLERLEEKPDHWFWALNAITRLDNVVPEESYGNLSEMADAWLNWGRQKGYIT